MALPIPTARLVLRRLAPSDLVPFQAYRHDARLGLYQGWLPQSDVLALEFLTGMSRCDLFPPGHWVQIGIADRGTNKLLGDIGVCVSSGGSQAEIGFTLATAAQGVGIGTEAVQAALQFIFAATSVGQVVAVTDSRNLPSIHLLERVGMSRVDTVAAVFRGAPCVDHHYAISRETAASSGSLPGMRTPDKKPLPQKDPPSSKPPMKDPPKAPNEDNTTNRLKERDKLSREIEKE